MSEHEAILWLLLGLQDQWHFGSQRSIVSSIWIVPKYFGLGVQKLSWAWNSYWFTSVSQSACIFCTRCASIGKLSTEVESWAVGSWTVRAEVNCLSRFLPNCSNLVQNHELWTPNEGLTIQNPKVSDQNWQPTIVEFGILEQQIHHTFCHLAPIVCEQNNLQLFTVRRHVSLIILDVKSLILLQMRTSMECSYTEICRS